MRIAISGATGFIGSHIATCLKQRGDEIIPLRRDFFKLEKRGILAAALSGCDAVINLAGATLNHHWSETYKRELYQSRIGTTRTLVETLHSLSHKPTLFISASAVGYYPSTGCFAESDARQGDDFLAHLCQAWEREATRVPPGVRWITMRLGIVLSPDGGAFPHIAAPARRHIALRFGSGTQNFSWIDLEDLQRAIIFLFDHPEINGPVNMVSPRRISIQQFTQAVAHHFRTWIILPLPAFLLRLIRGEAAEPILSGQCVYPEKLIEHGFTFHSESIHDFLARTS